MKELRLEPCDWLNYLRMNEDAYLLLLYITPELNDMNSNEIIEVQGLVDLQNDTSSGNVSNDAKYCRNKFVEYFVNEGRVEWQDDSVQKTYFE